MRPNPTGYRLVKIYANPFTFRCDGTPATRGRASRALKDQGFSKPFLNSWSVWSMYRVAALTVPVPLLG